MNILSMQEIEQIYGPGEGRHWFEASTMRFFKCRLASTGYQSADGSVYFVSSEQNSSPRFSYPRLYSVRRLTGPKGSIETVGEFQSFKTAGTANKYAKGYASGNISLPVKVAA